MSDLVRHVGQDEFDTTVRASGKPVLVDFWAEWCGPCKAIAPLLDELADDFGDQIAVVKVNVDDNQELAAAMGIRSIPTLMVFKGGESVAQQSGVSGYSQLKAFVAEAI